MSIWCLRYRRVLDSGDIVRSMLLDTYQPEHQHASSFRALHDRGHIAQLGQHSFPSSSSSSYSEEEEEGGAGGYTASISLLTGGEDQQGHRGSPVTWPPMARTRFLFAAKVRYMFFPSIFFSLVYCCVVLIGCLLSVFIQILSYDNDFPGLCTSLMFFPTLFRFNVINLINLNS